MKNGLRYVYTGNVHDFIGSSTHCYHCGDILVGRDWYELSTWNLSFDGQQASCSSCATPIAGVFESRPGAWCNRRMPIKITG
jgi:pyruvate formate lyase activating enzyme